MEQNKELYPNINSVPDNPYTQDYHEYIVDPGEVKNEVSKPRRVGSIILCAISNILLFSFCIIWTVVFCSILVDGSHVSVGDSVLLTIGLFFYLMPGFLITSIIAKIINRKSKWALINLICIGIIIVALIIISIIVPLLI